MIRSVYWDGTKNNEDFYKALDEEEEIIEKSMV